MNATIETTMLQPGSLQGLLRELALDLLRDCFEDEIAHLTLRMIRDAQAPRFEALKESPLRELSRRGAIAVSMANCNSASAGFISPTLKTHNLSAP